MLLGKRILAVVPARSGSKGVRDKNARLIGGKTMIQRAAEVLSVLDWVDFNLFLIIFILILCPFSSMLLK